MSPEFPGHKGRLNPGNPSAVLLSWATLNEWTEIQEIEWSIRVLNRDLERPKAASSSAAVTGEDPS